MTLTDPEYIKKSQFKIVLHSKNNLLFANETDFDFQCFFKKSIRCVEKHVSIYNGKE